MSCPPIDNESRIPAAGRISRGKVIFSEKTFLPDSGRSGMVRFMGEESSLETATMGKDSHWVRHSGPDFQFRCCDCQTKIFTHQWFRRDADYIYILANRRRFKRCPWCAAAIVNRERAAG
jgi:hypothetical protein